MIIPAIRAESHMIRGKAALPPKLLGLPFLGSSLDFLRDPFGFFVEAYQAMGPVFRIETPGRQYTVLAGPEANLFFARTSDDYLSSRELFVRALEDLGTENFVPALNGQLHRQRRKILKPSFSHGAIARYVPGMVQSTERIARCWQPGQCLKVKPTMQLLVCEQLGLTMTNHSLGEEGFKDAVTFSETLFAVAAGARPAFVVHLPRYRRAKARLVRTMQGLIAERRSQESNRESKREPDLLDTLLAARDEEGQPLSEVDLLAAALLPYIAGMDQTGPTCGYLLYSLLKRPALLEKVIAEVDEAFAAGCPDLQSLKQMKTLHDAAMETFRMYPVAIAAPRYVTQPLEFQGYCLEAGRMILIATSVTHFLPQFFPDPFSFDIDRYREPRNEHRQPGAFAPFALGPHTCIAAGLAEVMVMLTVASLLHTVHFELDPPDYTLKTTINPTPAPENRFGVRVVAQRKRISHGC